MSKTRILQLGAGPMLARTIRVLQEAGHEVYTVDKNPHAPGFAIADGYAPIDIVDAQAVMSYAREIKADLILPVIEAGLLEAAQISETLGLPSISPDIALNCLDKGRMRQCWEKAGLPQPAFRIVRPEDDPEPQSEAIGYPLVLKPTFGWGSRGVSRVSKTEMLQEAVRRARENSQTGEIIIEEFVPGTEMTIEGLVKNGQCQVLAKSDKEHQEHEHFCVAMALNYGADFDDSTLDRADALMARALQALGHTDGAFHCECMVNDKGIFLLESAARGGGGYIYSLIVEAVSGVNMAARHVDILLGRNPDIAPTHRRGACYKFFTPPEGVFHAIRGLDEAKRLPGILDMGFELASGSTVRAISSDAARPGYIVASGADRSEAIAHAQAALGRIEYDME